MAIYIRAIAVITPLSGDFPSYWRQSKHEWVKSEFAATIYSCFEDAATEAKKVNGKAIQYLVEYQRKPKTSEASDDRKT